MSNPSDLRMRLSFSAARIVRDDVDVAAGTAEWVTQGVMTHKFVVRTNEGTTYIVRFYPSTRSGVVEYEPDILRRAAAAGARVPEVVADSRRGPAAELNYVVYRRITGVPLSDRYQTLSAPQRAALGLELVEQLGHLTKVDFCGYGEVIDGCQASSNTWEEFIEATVRDGIAAATKLSLLSTPSIAAVGQLSDQIPEILTSVSPRLVWADCSLGNILVDENGRLAGLIDFEGVISGDGLLTLGYCQSLCDRQELFTDLVRAWPTPFGPEVWRRIDLYAVVRALRNAPFYSNPSLPAGACRSPLQTVYPGLEPAIRRLSEG